MNQPQRPLPGGRDRSMGGTAEPCGRAARRVACRAAFAAAFATAFATVLAAVLATATPAAAAAPLLPGSDDEVVQTLPGGLRGEDRALRRALAERPGDAELALRAAQRWLGRARALGDTRYAGQALAALAAWPDAAAAPAAVVLMQATLRHHLHQFDAAAAMLDALVVREPGDAQVWLTLATVRRVQGRIDASDAACRGLARVAGAAVHAAACLAENAGLRGHFDAARAALTPLAAAASLDDATRGWLLTTLAELEERAARPAAADSAWRAALRLDGGPYARLACADFLIRAGRAAEVPPLLDALPRSDAVLLRLAIAAAVHQGSAGPLGAELRERFEVANLRPEAGAAHGREQAMYWLYVERDAPRALALARANAQQQREPIDLLVLTQAARAARDRQAITAAAALVRDVGLVDARLK